MRLAMNSPSSRQLLPSASIASPIQWKLFGVISVKRPRVDLREWA